MTLARGVFGSRPRRDITQKQDGSRERAHSHKYARHTTRRRRADACAIESFPWARVRSDIQRHLSSRPLPSSLSIFLLSVFCSCRVSSIAVRCVPMFAVTIGNRNA